MDKSKDALKVSNYLLFDFAKATAAIPSLLWFRPKIVYSSDAARKRLRGGVLVISNHCGFLDPVYLMLAIWYRRHHFVCLDTFFEGKFKRWLFSQFHCIPINRENFSMFSLRSIIDALRAGRMVTMFPEGHISTQKGIETFKSGMVLLAYQSAKPILPVYIRPRKHWYSRLVVCIGEPMDVRSLIGEKASLSKFNQIAAELEEKEKALSYQV